MIDIFLPHSHHPTGTPLPLTLSINILQGWICPELCMPNQRKEWPVQFQMVVLFITYTSFSKY
jgi:hypothetical protein